jgi:hypothetical protein
VFFAVFTAIASHALFPLDVFRPTEGHHPIFQLDNTGIEIAHVDDRPL